MRPLPHLAALLLPLALVAGCDDASTAEPIPPAPTGRPVIDAAPSLADAPALGPAAPSTEPEDEPITAASKPAGEPVAAAKPMEGAPPLPPRPRDQDPRCAKSAELLASGDKAMVAGDPASGRKLYLEVVKLYPNCPEIPHAYLAFGEYFFAEGKLPEARQCYVKVTEFPEPALVAFATYKIGWCDLNAGNAIAALEAFVRVLTLTDGDKVGQAALRDAALRDSVYAYADAADPRKAAAFYRRWAGEAGMRAALSRLATLYLDRGERPQATVVCESAPGACR